METVYSKYTMLILKNVGIWALIKKNNVYTSIYKIKIATRNHAIM
jgi:hypothetical protein